MVKIKKRFIVFGFIIIVAGVYLVGPKPGQPSLDTMLPSTNSTLNSLEASIIKSENNHISLKEDNNARIIWADSAKKTKTKYSVVYLHGFSASQAEGDPIHREFAMRYGCNLYLSRLEQHGLDTANAFVDLTAEKLLNSAKNAVSIAKRLGDSLIIIATSNGGAMALYIASGHPEIKGLIIYSPLIDFYAPSTKLLDKPWGLQIARTVTGKDLHVSSDTSFTSKKYWTTIYRLEGAVALKNLIENITGPTIYKKIKAPLFLGYYYKNDEQQDKVVSVKAMLQMYDNLGTAVKNKRKVAFPNVGNHVIASRFKSLDVKSVRNETFKFAEEVLGMKRVK